MASAHAAALQEVSVQLTRQGTATTTNVAISFITPTGIDQSTDLIQLHFPSDFNISAITFSDVTLTYGATTGNENATTMAAAQAPGFWAAEIDPVFTNILTISPPSDAGVGTIPAGNRVIIRIGVWTTGSNAIETAPTGGVYQLHINGAFGDSGNGYVFIGDLDGIGVSATIGSSPPASSGGGSAPIDTGPPPYDGTAPVISTLRAEEITPVRAMIRWTTNEAADAYLEYGTAEGVYTLGARTRTDRLTTHEFLLESLAPETTYHLRVRARDASGNTSFSQNVSFQTQGLTVPPTEPDLAISGIEVAFVDDQQAVIRWTTNRNALSEVRIGIGAEQQSIPVGTAGQSHTVTITGLTPQTSYGFQVRARLTETSEYVTVEGPGFRTVGDRTPPSNVLSFRGIYNVISGLIELRWTNPSDPDLRDVVVTRILPDALLSEVAVCTTIAGFCTDTRLTGLSDVMYRAVARDLSGNRSSGAITTVRIEAPQAPVTPPASEPPATTQTPPITSTPTAPTSPSSGATLPPILRPEASGGTGMTGGAPISGGSTPMGDGVTLPPILPEGADGSSVTSTVPLEGGAGEEDALQLSPIFFLSTTVPATPNADGIRFALGGQPIQVHLPTTGMQRSLQQAQVQVSDGSIYQFVYREGVGAFVSEFAFDPASGERQSVSIRAIAANGQAWEQTYVFRMQSLAQITDRTDAARVVPLADVTIEITSLDSDTVIRRVQTDGDGRYAEILPNGSYRVRVLKEGFREEVREVRVETGILVEDIQLRRQVRGLAELFQKDASALETAQAVASELVFLAEIGLDAARQPEVQAITRTVVAPAVVVASVGVTATAVSGFSLLNYLHFFFTQPFLLIRRRKRQSWGVVYNALSKQPIELAIVRLLKAGTTFAIQTRITDAQGRFSFFVTPGSYTIQIQKPGYQFPTTYLKEERMDVDFVDLYHGEEIEVKEPVTISPNIPVDPIAKEEAPKALLRKQALRKVQSLAGFGGVLIGCAAVIISPTLLMGGFALFQVATYALFRRLAIPKAPKRWGIVYDSDGKNPLTKVVVRIFDKKFNKLLETQITSKNGAYGFFAAKGQYYLTAEKPGYERYLSGDLDLTKAKDTYVDHRFRLTRAGSAQK